MTAEKALHKCSHCSKEFKYESEKKRHELSHFPKFQCMICSKNFSFVSALRRHEKQHERTGTAKCNDCGREFRDQILLKRHIKYAHGESYTCEKCNSVFHSEAALRSHMQTHKSVSERRYHCSFQGCTKKFNFPHHLKNHELTHTNTKQHFCKICGKGFIQSHHLKTHLKTHSGDKSLDCSYPDCNRKFATEYTKKRHMAKYHIKPDSEISSDSNSACDILRAKPNILEAEFIVKDDEKLHLSEVITTTYCEEQTMYTDNDEFTNIDDELTIENSNNLYETAITSDNEVNNCKLALGGCIMDEKGENCVCIHISKNVNNECDFTPIETDPVQVNNLDSSNTCKISECCGGSCIAEGDAPTIEYKSDGTVKIKEFLNTDDITQENDRILKNDAKFIPYNSCKAVLGNCIVSGNGTMGDGCLCAKMIKDDEVNSQEIDDITPRPMEDFSIVI